MRHSAPIWCVAVLAALALVPVRAAAQTPPPATPPSQVATAPQTPPGVPATYTFESGAGLVFYYVDKAKAADFEAVLDRLREALNRAETPMLKQQALNWRIYKSAEPVTDAAVFVFAFDPAVTTANYDPLLVLAEVSPSELHPLYERMRDAIIKVERMGLTKIR